jgi:non-homologous end joining protein Ku
MPPIVMPVKRVYQSASSEDEDVPVQNSDLVKGFEAAKSQYVVLDEEELRQIMPKTSSEMEIVEFVQVPTPTKPLQNRS